MTLPDIPDEAIAAAQESMLDRHPVRASPAGGGYSTVQGQVEATLAGAWPHLYAAALRHAAADLEERDYCFVGLTHLREMADEATA